MCGRLGRDRRGQLALMDSMVFFAAALVICSLIVSYARPSPFPDLEQEGDSDPAEILQVLLRASIGRSVTIELDGVRHLDGSEDVASCIAVEADAVRSGASQTVFTSLNNIIAEIIDSICNPVFEPVLVVYDIDDGLSTPILKLPDKELDSMNRCASSVEIPGGNGENYLVVLVLTPAAPSELV